MSEVVQPREERLSAPENLILRTIVLTGSPTWADQTVAWHLDDLLERGYLKFGFLGWRLTKRARAALAADTEEGQGG